MSSALQVAWSAGACSRLDFRCGQGVVELARRIGVTRQQRNRLTNLKHAAKIDRIDAALRALEKRLMWIRRERWFEGFEIPPG
jgi:hypothetical protein